MSLKIKLKTAMKEAMKARDKLALEIVRSLLSAIQYEEMKKSTEELSDDQIIAVLKAEQKKLGETKEFAEKAGRAETVSEAEKQMAVITTFLPSQLEREDLEKIIAEFATSSDAINVGTVMKYLKENYSGQYDGKMASELAKLATGG